MMLKSFFNLCITCNSFYLIFYKRIFKPRVRNAVACFEIIWSAPGQLKSPYHLFMCRFFKRSLPLLDQGWVGSSICDMSDATAAVSKRQFGLLPGCLLVTGCEAGFKGGRSVTSPTRCQTSFL